MIKLAESRNYIITSEYETVNLEIKNRNQIIEVLEHLFLYCNKLIIYSIEKLTPSGEVLDVLALNRKQPFVEPRYITTRVNLEEEIPYRVYEYIEWFKKNCEKAIILLPNEKKVNKIYENFNFLLKFFKFFTNSALIFLNIVGRFDF